MDRPSANALSAEYLAFLRERNEPEAPWVGEATGPLVIREIEGGFGLFRPWQSQAAGDAPVAEFQTVEDARLAVAARAALRRSRFYQLQVAGEEVPAGGYVVEREGEPIGRVRTWDPDWVFACHVLACTAQASEHLATLLELAGSSAQEEVGEILGRAAKRGADARLPGQGAHPSGEAHPEWGWRRPERGCTRPTPGARRPGLGSSGALRGEAPPVKGRCRTRQVRLLPR